MSPPRPAPHLRPDRVVVINDASVARGGATGVALTSARGLAEAGLDVTLLAGDSGPAAADAPYEVVALGAPEILEGSRPAAMLRGLYNHKARRFVSDFLRVTDTPRTVYHLHGWSKRLSPAIFSALAPVLDRTVVSAHDFFSTCPNGGYFDFRREQVCDLDPMSARCIATNCDRRHYAHKLWRTARHGVTRALWNQSSGPLVLPVHDGMVPHLARGGIAPDRLRVLRNPVEAWRPERVPAENNRHFLYVGRLTSDKGADHVAEAAHAAGAPLRIIGTGPLEQTIARRFPAVECLGWQDRAAIAHLVGDARALVMPSRTRETFGLVALEALLSGIPVIVTRQAMLAQEISEAGFGLSCGIGDFAAAISRLAADDALVEAMSRAAFAHARALAPTTRQWLAELQAIYAATLSMAEHEHTRRQDGQRAFAIGDAMSHATSGFSQEALHSAFPQPAATRRTYDAP